MDAKDEYPPAPLPDDILAARGATSLRVLDPVSRASEVLFGLIMVLTFTLSLGAAGSGREDVRAILIGALGCDFAWAIIDAVMYLMGTSGERRLAVSTVQLIHDAESASAGRAILSSHLPPAVLPALTFLTSSASAFTWRASRPRASKSRFGREDYLAALGVLLLVFLSLFRLPHLSYSWMT